MSTGTKTRNDRLEEIVREVAPHGDPLDLGLGTTDSGDGYARSTDRQYVLVERNIGRARDEQSHSFTRVDSLEDAAQTSLGNEYAEDWDVVFCVDLDTGWKYLANEKIVWTTEGGETVGDLISRESIIGALRDAERNDSAADAFEWISDMVGWSAEDDEELRAERAEQDGEDEEGSYNRVTGAPS